MRVGLWNREVVDEVVVVGTKGEKSEGWIEN